MGLIVSVSLGAIGAAAKASTGNAGVGAGLAWAAALSSSVAGQISAAGALNHTTNINVPLLGNVPINNGVIGYAATTVGTLASLGQVAAIAGGLAVASPLGWIALGATVVAIAANPDARAFAGELAQDLARRLNSSGFTLPQSWSAGDPATGMPWGGASPLAGMNLPANDPQVSVVIAVPYDPLVLDLDGDGIETVGLDAGVKFDGNADGLKTTTGWAGKDDGMLVWDRDGNGQIDSGRELFGDQTLLASGGLAANGFAALSEQDTNQDGKVDSGDANFASLKIWQDTNQDGISQADELFTLAQKGIQSVNVAAQQQGTFGTGTTVSGGRLTHLGAFTKTDGSQGVAGNLLFNQDNFHTEYVNHLTVSEAAKTIVNYKGAGYVRNLQEAATLDAGLISKVAAVKAATTRAGYKQAIGDLMQAWGVTAQNTAEHASPLNKPCQIRLAGRHACEASNDMAWRVAA
jgi:hypothetical protein